MTSKTTTKIVDESVKNLNCRSVFALTFAVEVVGLGEVWEDRNEGWLEQGACAQGIRLQLLLYPGHLFELDIMIWPHTAKIWCGSQYGWVRVWQFLERRWLAFSIRFAFPVRVLDMQAFVATVTPSFGLASLGSNAKNDKNCSIYLPPLSFGVRRYFGPVLEREKESLVEFVTEIIWKTVETYVPWSCFDGTFYAPGVVADVRHQDTCLDMVRDLILKRTEEPEAKKVISKVEVPIMLPKSKKDLKAHKSREKEIEKEKEKKEASSKIKYEIRLPGESILSGTGRVVSFETVGVLSPESPEIVVLISSNNLPAQDDLPLVFVNVENLYQIPLNELKILRITHLYIKWQVGDEVNSSEPQKLESKAIVNFNNHRALPVPCELLLKTISQFLDNTFKIELRGIRLPPAPKDFQLFGYEKGDRDFGRSIPKFAREELDFVIAVTRINAKLLSRGINSFLKGEFPLYPPVASVKSPERETFCTNDINCIRGTVAPSLVVTSAVILQAQMTLDVSLGVVGCTSHTSESFSRMFCTIRDSDSILSLLRCITETNEEIILTGNKADLLSGFAIDTGSHVILFIEGPRYGHILRIWEMTEDFYPKLKPLFSCSDRYSTRIYSEFVSATVPFIVLKMFVPLGVILACPPVYARPALPLPTRSAVLKIGRLIVNDLRSIPARCEMPTTAELKSFRLELCVAPRPTPVTINDAEVTIPPDTLHEHLQQRINWNK